MVMTPVPSLDELIWLFEAEPTPRHPDEVLPGGGSVDWRRDWPHTTVTFELHRGDTRLVCTVSPGYEQVRLICRQADDETVDLALRRVIGMAVERLHDRELLRLDFRDDGVVGPLYLRTKPTVGLAWSVGRDA
jgi:hypothetical protein